MIGTSLGPYKIIEQLGAGGMGEVPVGRFEKRLLHFVLLVGAWTTKGIRPIRPDPFPVAAFAE